MLSYVHQYFFSLLTLVSKLILFLTQVTHYMTAIKTLRKYINWKPFV